MYERAILGLKESQEAIQVMIREVESKKEYYWQQGVFAICDFAGILIALARMDGAGEEGVLMATKKAYTSAIWGRSTTAFRDVVGEPMRVSSFGTSFTLSKGGVPIINPTIPKSQFMTNHVVGAIGVSSVGPGEKDEEVALVGLKYLENILWP